MHPVTSFKELPKDLVVYVSRNLEKSVEVIALAETCTHFCNIFKSVDGNHFFTFCNGLNANSLYAQIFYLKSFDFIFTSCRLITTDFFTKTTTSLCGSFPKCKLNVIEGSLRKAIATDANKKE